MLQPTTLLADPSLGFSRVRNRADRWASVRPRPVKVSRRWFAVVAALFLAFAGLAFLRMWPPLATVMSGSMEPTIHTGDMVVLQRLDRPARVGDIVVVNVPDEARSRFGYPPVVIHRIVRVAQDGTVSTKGDARKTPDPFTVPRRALNAHVVGHIPAGGRVMAFLTSPLGLLWLGGGALMLIGLPLLERRREEQLTVADELSRLRAERAAVDARCDALSQELALVTQTFTDHLAALPAQLEAAVAAAMATRPPAVEPAAETAVNAVPPMRAGAEPRTPPIAFAAGAAWAQAELPFERPVSPIAFAAGAAWAQAELPFERPVPPIAVAAAAAWEDAELPFATDPLDQLELALSAGPRAALAADESEAQLAFALDVERAPRFVRPGEDQLAFELGTPAVKPDQLVISTPPPGPRWDAPPASFVVRRRSGGLVGRALSLLAA